MGTEQEPGGRAEGQPPSRCQWCNACLQYHGGHGRPYRRLGWFRYECGTKWHPKHGWSHDLSGRCRANALERVLKEMLRQCDTIDDGYCLVCTGRRLWTKSGRPGKCENPDCPSHVWRAALKGLPIKT